MHDELKIDLLENDKFHFFMPIDAVKAKKGEKDDGRRWIQGIASTEARDLQDEIVRQRGIDFAYFLKHGFINDDHKPGPDHKVGEPTECRLTSAGLWLKGFLYPAGLKPAADKWWEHLKAIEASGSSRRVGFSIQGKIQRRAGKTIEKCWLQDVAITASPVNTNTWAEIAKSLYAEKWCVHPWKTVNKACGRCQESCVKRTDEHEEKALTVAGQGAVLVPESLEGAMKVQTHKSLVDRYTLAEAVKMLELEKGYSNVRARVIADAIFTNHGAH